LRLTNVRTSGYCEVDELLLRDLPNSLVELLKYIWDLANLLNRSVVSHKLVFDFWDPKIEFN
jgi:hypothetical protein